MLLVSRHQNYTVEAVVCYSGTSVCFLCLGIKTTQQKQWYDTVARVCYSCVSASKLHSRSSGMLQWHQCVLLVSRHQNYTAEAIECYSDTSVCFLCLNIKKNTQQKQWRVYSGTSVCFLCLGIKTTQQKQWYDTVAQVSYSCVSASKLHSRSSGMLQWHQYVLLVSRHQNYTAESSGMLQWHQYVLLVSRRQNYTAEAVVCLQWHQCVLLVSRHQKLHSRSNKMLQ